MKVKTILLSLLLAIILSACLPRSIKGAVIEKKHTAAYTTTALIPMKAGKVLILIPMITYHPQAWHLLVRVCNEDKCQGIYWPVEEKIYSKYSVNDVFDSENP